ncbi:MAG TPA: hypothetical protein EYQ24_15775 [Bacteroidetes bacterium]|nr:hypothetical protein [Bacteroidota bacterium]
MRRLLPFALLPLLVAGCDSTGLTFEDVRRAYLYEIELEDFPTRQPDGNDWDSGLTVPEPDIYFTLETPSGFVIAETEPLANVEGRDLPVFYPVPDVELELDEPLYIVAWDDDGVLDDEFMDDIGPFRVGTFLEQDLDESFRLTSDSRDLEVTLRVEWDD